MWIFYLSWCNDSRLSPDFGDGVKLHCTGRILQHRLQCTVHVKDNFIIEYLSKQISLLVKKLYKKLQRAKIVHVLDKTFQSTLPSGIKSLFLWKAITIGCLFIVNTTLMIFCLKQEFVKSSLDWIWVCYDLWDKVQNLKTKLELVKLLLSLFGFPCNLCIDAPTTPGLAM